MTKVERFEDITKNLNNLYRIKNHDYGDSFGSSVNKYGLIAALTRVSDKFNRLETLILNKNNSLVSESISDTLLDLAAYCIMTKIEVDDLLCNECSTTSK